MKRNAIARIVIWSLVVLLLTSILIMGINSSPSSFFSGNWSFGVTGISYKNAALYNVGGGAVNDEFYGVEIEWINGKIEIEGYDGDRTDISETETSDDSYKLRWRVEEGVLKIHPAAAGMRYGFKKVPKKTLTLKIPVSAADKLKFISTDSTSAEIEINRITVSNKIELDTVSGDATLRNVKAEKLDIETVSGDIRADGEFTELETDSVSGDVSVTTAVPLKKFDGQSTSGNIALALPQESGFTLEADTVSGDISCGLPTVSESRNRRICGDGSAEFKTDTVSGDVIITDGDFFKKSLS